MFERQVLIAAAGVALALALAPESRGADDVATCVACHAEQAGEFAQSVHAALKCQECHAGEETYPVTTPAPSGAFDHGLSFKGKPQRADVPVLCGTCHQDVQRMNPYGLRTDQLARYWTSGHGSTLKKNGDSRVAVCVDCHGVHDILHKKDPRSRTNPLNVPDTCGHCHADASLMGEFDLPVEVVSEYRASVHGKLLLEQGDSGAPTCATCHGNHSAMPPGVASVGSVCGQCHQHVAEMFAKSIHASQSDFEGCVQCHGGGEDRHFHLIERINQPPGIMFKRYAHLLKSNATPTDEQIGDTIHPDAKKIITQALPTCLECHEELDEDESLPKLFGLLDEIADAERYYVQTAERLSKVGKGVLLVDSQKFRFEDAKTHLIALAPTQHTLDNEVVGKHVSEMNAVCDQVNGELDALENGLATRYRALIPIWAFALCFSFILYMKFKRLKRDWVKPMAHGEGG